MSKATDGQEAENRMMAIYLNAYQREFEALEFLDGITWQLTGKPNHGAACRAWAIVKGELEKTVDQITRLGGLLLIGGRA